MYTLLAVNLKKSSSGQPWSQIPWAAYGFDTHIHHTDTTHMLEAVRTEKPDAVFIDIDGVADMGSLIGALSHVHTPCPCVVISRERNQAHLREAMRAGAFDYCTKPLTQECLMDVIHALKKRLETQDRSPALQDRRLTEIIAYIDTHLQEKLSLAGIADTFYMSKNYLCYYFKRHMGVNFVEYLSSLRIEKAKTLLVSAMTMDEIAEKTGFSDTPYFIKVFKKYEGVSPGAYRRSIQP